MLTIDGSEGEGGGQMLRTALALSTIYQIPFTMTNIRANRRDPGLKTQHLYGIKALEQWSGAKSEGASLGSGKIEFFPNSIYRSKVVIPITTAGSITLILQSILPAMVFQKKKITVEIEGGTDVPWSPQLDYISQVLLPQLRRWADIRLYIERRGYYPRGGGLVKLEIKGRCGFSGLDQEISNPPVDSKPTPQISLPKILLNAYRPPLVVRGFVHCAKDLEQARVLERIRESAMMELKKFRYDAVIDGAYYYSKSPGCGITLWAVCSEDDAQPSIIGADRLGEPSVSSETLGRECAKTLLTQLNAPVDKFLADQLIPYLAIAGGSYTATELSSHTKTNIMIANLFKYKIKIEGNRVFTD